VTSESPKKHFRALHAVRALRIIVLVVLAGFTVALIVTYGRRGRPQTEITMATTSLPSGAQGPVMDKSDSFEINGSREGRPAFTLRADTVTGFAGDRKLLERVHLTVHDESGRAITIAGREGQFDAARRRAQIAGDVAITTEDGLSLRTGTLFYDSDRDMIFTADDITFNVGALSGEGRGLNYLVTERQIKIPDRVRLRVTTEDGGELVITSADLVASLQANTVVFTDDVRMARGADVLRGNYLKLFLDEERRRVTRLHAFGDVMATMAAAGAASEVRELRADSLTAGFSAVGGIEQADASGNCRFTSGLYTSRSRTARYLKPADILELRGEPVVLSETERIGAQEIDLHPDGQVLDARGDVRTVRLPGVKEGAATPGFGGRAAVSFQAASLHAEQGTRRATYRGAARVWQEGNSLQAEEIVLDDAARQLQARGKVMGRFTQRAAGGAGGPGRPLVTTLLADSMVYEDALGVGRYRGGVRMNRLDATLTADQMDAWLADSQGERQLDRIEARGAVAIKQAGSFGTAREAEYRAAEDVLVMRDEEGLAQVVDAATGRTLRGRALTFDLAGDRILTESAQGGRTWITLTPDSKDVKAVDPKTRH
jgi:LPS export ABC transporter protein LptC